MVEKYEENDLIKQESKPVLNKGKEFKLSDFEISKELGNGAYAKVYSARSKVEGDTTEYALKAFNKTSLVRESKLYQVYVEAELMLFMKNDYIAKIYGAFEENKKCILVMDVFKNGDLFDFISANSKFFYKNYF
jgi:serine/threonine protein kinase